MFNTIYENLTVKDYVVIYAGRFHPPHINHYNTYKHLCDTFGLDKVYISMSAVEGPNSPFSYEDRAMIWSDMFGVNKGHLVKSQRPYTPHELLNTLPDTTQLIAVVGQKDSDRLKGKYFIPYHKDEKMVFGYKDVGYVYVAPEQLEEADGERITGTYVRTVFEGLDIQKKKDLFKRLYGEDNYDKYIFDMISNRLTKKPE